MVINRFDLRRRSFFCLICFTCALDLVKVLFVGVECESEVEQLEAAVVAAPHQVGRLQVRVDVRATVQRV